MLKKFPKGHKCPQCGSIRNIMAWLGRSTSISLSKNFVTQNLCIFIITNYKWLAFKSLKDGKNMRSNLWKPPLHNPTAIVAEAKFYIVNHVFLVCESFQVWFIFIGLMDFFRPILSKKYEKINELKLASKNYADKTELQVKRPTTQRNMCDNYMPQWWVEFDNELRE